MQSGGPLINAQADQLVFYPCRNALHTVHVVRRILTKKVVTGRDRSGRLSEIRTKLLMKKLLEGLGTQAISGAVLHQGKSFLPLQPSFAG